MTFQSFSDEFHELLHVYRGLWVESCLLVQKLRYLFKAQIPSVAAFTP